MKPKTLLILATLTALLAAFVYFVERDLPSTDERKDLETKVLTVETDDVTGVTLRADGREVRLERTAKGPDKDDADPAETNAQPEWRVVEPIQARADAAAVTGLLGRLTGLRIERTLEDVDTATAGLDEPRAEVVITTEKGDATLQLGTEVPLSEDALVRVSGSAGGAVGAGKVVQTGFGDELLDTVGQAAGDWRDKRLFFDRRDNVQSVAWTDPDGQRVLLSRRGDGDNFWIESPIQDRADTEKVRGFLSSLTSLEASSFESDSPEGVDFEPSARLEVVLAGKETPWVLELAGEGQTVSDAETVSETETVSEAELLARVDGQLVRLARGPVTEAMVGPSDTWRSRAWSHQQAFQIDEALIDQAGQELLAIRRHDSDWLRSVGDAARVSEDAEGKAKGDEVPYTAASNVLYPLTEVAAEELAQPSDLQIDLSQPQLTITLVNEGDEEVLNLYARTASGSYAARTSGREVVLLLPADKVTELLDAVKALREAEPEAPPSVDVGEDDA